MFCQEPSFLFFFFRYGTSSNGFFQQVIFLKYICIYQKGTINPCDNMYFITTSIVHITSCPKYTWKPTNLQESNAKKRIFKKLRLIKNTLLIVLHFQSANLVLAYFNCSVHLSSGCTDVFQQLCTSEVPADDSQHR